jgi:phosphate transport system permease protein
LPADPPSVSSAAQGGEPLPPPLEPDESRGRHARIWRTVRWLVPIVPALAPAAIVATIIVTLFVMAGLSVHLSLVPPSVTVHWPENFGWGFFGSVFNPSPAPGRTASWGILVFVVGSFLTAVPALFLAMGIGLGIAIASTSYLPQLISRWLDPFVDLLAGIPSVVLGIWAFLFIGPILGHHVNPWMAKHLAFIPGLAGPSGTPLGEGLPLTIFVLTLMTLPITTLLIRDALRSVPRDLWESSLALGATRWETTRRVSLPYGIRGIFSAGLLGFGRAFGETVAVAMVLGVQPVYPANFYGETGTMASIMFDLLSDAIGTPHFLAILSEMGIVLLAISLTVNVLGRRFVSTFVGYEIAGM